MANVGQCLTQSGLLFIGPAAFVFIDKGGDRVLNTHLAFDGWWAGNSGNVHGAFGATQAFLDFAPSVFLRGKHTSDPSQKGLFVS